MKFAQGIYFASKQVFVQNQDHCVLEARGQVVVVY